MLKLLPIALSAGLLIPSMVGGLLTASQDDAEQETSALEESMGTLKRGQRGLKKLIAEPAENQAKLMEMLISMEAAALTAMQAMPPEPKDLPETDLALWHVGYRHTLTNLLGTILTMEDATLRGDAKALAAAYKELGKTKKAGHEEYQQD